MAERPEESPVRDIGAAITALWEIASLRPSACLQCGAFSLCDYWRPGQARVGRLAEIASALVRRKAETAIPGHGQIEPIALAGAAQPGRAIGASLTRKIWSRPPKT